MIAPVGTIARRGVRVDSKCEARVIRFNCPNCGRHYELPDALASLPLVCKQCGQRLTPPAPSPDPPPKPAAPRPVAVPVAKSVPKPAAAPKPAPVPTVELSLPPAPPPPAPAKRPALVPDAPDDDDVLVAKPDESPDIDFNIGGPTAASLSDATRARSTGLTDATRRPPDLSGAVGPVDSIAELNLDLLGPPPPVAAPKAPPPPPTPEEPVAEKPEPTMLPFLADLGAFILLVVVGLFLGEFLARKPMGQVISESGSAPKFPPVDLILLVGPPVMFGLVYLLLGSRECTLGAWLRRRRSAPPS